MKNNWLNIIFFIGVTLMVVISFVIILKTFEKKIITDNDIQVTAEVIEAPSSCKDLGRRPPYSKIKFNNKVFVKKTGNKFCHFVSQKKQVTMLTNENKDELIFLNEYDPMQFTYAVLILIIAVIISIKKLKS